MQDLNDKMTGGNLTAAEWNEVPSELQNIITAFGITLSSGDLNQLGKAIAGYVGVADFFFDTGSANILNLISSGSQQPPTEYNNGMRIRFEPAANNTSSSVTVNVAGLGVKDVRNGLGTSLFAGDLQTGRYYTAIFNAGADNFRVVDLNANTGRPGLVQIVNTFGTSTSLVPTQNVVETVRQDTIDAQGTADQAIIDAAAAQATADQAANDLLTKVDRDLPVNVTGTWEWQNNIEQRFGDNANISIKYDPSYNSFGGLVTNIGPTALWGINDGTQDILLYNGTNFIYAPETGSRMSGDNVSIQINPANDASATNRFLLGDTIDTTNWVLLGNLPGDNNGVQGFTVDLRRSFATSNDYYRAELNGVAVFRVTNLGNVQGVGAYTNLSDISTKENIKDLSDVANSLDIVMGLKPKRFNRIAELGGEQEDGFIAQDVEQVFPEAVTVVDDGTRSESGQVLKGVQETRMIPHLVSAIQKLEKRLADLESSGD